MLLLYAILQFSFHYRVRNQILVHGLAFDCLVDLTMPLCKCKSLWVTTILGKFHEVL